MTPVYSLRMKISCEFFSRSLRLSLLLGVSLVCFAMRCDAEEEKKTFYKPLPVEVEGWTVQLDPRLKEGEGAEVGKKALRALSNHLYRITLVMPEKALKDLRTIPIRLELDNDVLKSMQYHPSVGWLKNNGHDPALAKHVHMPFAHRLYDKKTLLKQPWVVLHELAHGYHDQILGFEHKGVMEAYTKAKESGINQSVLLYTGKKVSHYAETNQKEYFAEMTEAYFGLNDFYPFMRAELKEHDPLCFKVMEEVWGKRP